MGVGVGVDEVHTDPLIFPNYLKYFPIVYYMQKRDGYRSIECHMIRNPCRGEQSQKYPLRTLVLIESSG